MILRIAGSWKQECVNLSVLKVMNTKINRGIHCEGNKIRIRNLH